MIVIKHFPLRVTADQHYTDWICPEDRYTLSVSDDKKDIKIYDYEDKLIGTATQEDCDHIMTLLIKFSYASLNISVEMNYDEDNGHTLVMHVHARINVANQQQTD